MSKATLEELLEGNRRFARSKRKVLLSQAPKAIVLCCSDSRVPPQVIFDQEVGDLFIVRVAGNVAAPTVLDSLIFGAKILKVPLLIVLGHQDCGAIHALLEGGEHLEELSHLFPYLEGAIQQAPTRGAKEVTFANIREQVAFLKANPTLAQLVRDDALAVVGAYYDIEKGEVELLS